VPWERVVLLIFQQVGYAAIDITNLSIGSPLEWEVKEARRRNLRILYFCERARAKSAMVILASITGDQKKFVFEYEPNVSDDEAEFFELEAYLRAFFRPGNGPTHASVGPVG